MNLGLMAVAANAGMEADRRQKVFDYDQKKRESELSLLDDRTAADRTGYQLRSAQNQQGLDLLPGDTENKKTAQKTAGIKASMGLADAENDQANHPKTLQIRNNALEGQLMTSNAELAALPGKLQQAAVQGVLNQQGQADVVLGTLGQLIARNDKDSAIRFANQVAQMPNVLPNTNGKPLADIKGVRKGDVIGKDQSGSDVTAQGDGYLFVTNDGQAHFNPVTTISAAMNKLKSGEYQFIHTNDGSVYSGNKQTGAVNQVHQGDSKALRAQHTPAEVQTMEWLIGKGVARDANAAWDMVRSAREKTRNSFIMDYVGKNALPNQSAAQLADLQRKAGDVYDQLRPGQGPVNPAPAPNAAPSNAVDPQIRNLLGIPAQ